MALTYCNFSDSMRITLYNIFELTKAEENYKKENVSKVSKLFIVQVFQSSGKKEQQSDSEAPPSKKRRHAEEVSCDLNMKVKVENEDFEPTKDSRKYVKQA